jgi:hypothetical protein
MNARLSLYLLGAGITASLLLGDKPAEAAVCGVGQQCYTFSNAVANDTINQNQGSVNITGSFNIPTGTSVATATEANVTFSFNTPPATVSGQSSFFFNSAYTTNVGGNTALILFCNPLTTPFACTGGNGIGTGNALTYQAILGFGVNFATGPFPASIDLQALNNGNINQICGEVKSSDVGTNTCENGENNRFELSTFNAGSKLDIPSPFSSLILAPLAASLASARKRYRFGVSPKALATKV